MRPNTVIENPNQRESQHTSRSLLAKKKYKVLLTKNTLSTYSFMLVTIEKQKDGGFVADIAFSSSSSSSSSSSDVTKDIESIKESELADVIGKHPLRTFRIRGKSRFFMDITIHREQEAQQYNHGDFVADIAFSSSSSDVTKDIESIKESELADAVKKYRLFVECIKAAEQKELSKRSKNAFQRIDVRSIIQHVAQAVNASTIKKTMITNSTYIKNATLNTVKIRRIMSDFNELKNKSVKRDIYTKITVGGTVVSTRSTIELDADIVSVIQKQPEITNLTIRNFILNIHTSNVSLSTFFLLNKINETFSNCRMIIGFSRMATTPISIYNLLFISPDPFSIVGLAIPTGLFIFIPRIARLVIKYRIRKTLFFRKRNMTMG